MGGRRARPTACGRGSRSSPAFSTIAAGCLSSSASTSGTRPTSGICATSGRSRAWRCCSPTRPRPIIPASRRAIAPRDHVLGMYHALVEGRVPFEMVHEAYLTPERLDAFKLLILADAAALSDAQCAAIRAYVARGGSVLATFASSLYDEAGQRRADFGLADVFGVSFGGRVDGPMQNSYLNLDADPATGRRHPVLAGLDGTPRIINGVFRVARDADDDVSVAAHAHSVVSGPADGGRLSARAAHRHPRALPTRGRGESRGLRAVGYRPHVLGSDVSRPRPAASQSRGVDHERAGRPWRSPAPASSTSPPGASATR